MAYRGKLAWYKPEHGPGSICILVQIVKQAGLPRVYKMNLDGIYGLIRGTLTD